MKTEKIHLHTYNAPLHTCPVTLNAFKMELHFTNTQTTGLPKEMDT